MLRNPLKKHQTPIFQNVSNTSKLRPSLGLGLLLHGVHGSENKPHQNEN